MAAATEWTAGDTDSIQTMYECRQTDLEHNIYATADPAHMLKFPWYFGTISREDAERYLKLAHTSGHFLIRESKTTSHYALGVIYNGKVKHFLIVKNRLGSYQVDGSDKSFKSLTGLVNFYKTHRISHEGEKLKTPCPGEGMTISLQD